MTRPIFRIIPSTLRPPLRRLYEYVEYEASRRIGRRDPLLPPRWLHSVATVDLNAPPDYDNYKAVGQEFFRYFVNIGGMQPGQRVLDVGSGTGRMALPLTKFLKDGSYDGIEIVERSVRWCQKTYTPRYPNFRFHFSDVYNKLYNPGGSCSPSDYRFPFDHSTFDFVFLTSVFTHMLPADLVNYLSEIVRVLKSDGRCLITYFLLNGESSRLIDRAVTRPSENSVLTFEHNSPGCRLQNADVPEEAVAYEESTIRSLYQRNGLNILGSIYFGKWCGRENGLTQQDMVVASKSP